MKLSARTQYGLLALVHLARADASERVAASSIAKAQGVPLKFLEQILRTMEREGLVTSHRGRHGGYQLARPAEEITLGEAVRLLDGPDPQDTTHLEGEQRLLLVFGEIRASAADRLETTTLGDVR